MATNNNGNTSNTATQTRHRAPRHKPDPASQAAKVGANTVSVRRATITTPDGQRSYVYGASAIQRALAQNAETDNGVRIETVTLEAPEDFFIFRAQEPLKALPGDVLVVTPPRLVVLLTEAIAADMLTDITPKPTANSSNGAEPNTDADTNG